MKKILLPKAFLRKSLRSSDGMHCCFVHYDDNEGALTIEKG